MKKQPEENRIDTKKLQNLINQVRTFPLTEGCNKTEIPYLNIYRYTVEKIKMPQTESLYLYVVLDGSIRLYTPTGIMDYMAGQYSVSEIDTPVSGQILTYSQRKDVLALSIEFTIHDVISVVLDLEGNLAEQIINSEIGDEDRAASDRSVITSMERLISLRNEPLGLAFMAKHILQEIIFYILCGSCGQQFLQSMINIQQAGEIYEVNSWIKRNFRNSFTVEELAEKRNMSVSLFHQKFKSAVGMGPLQCQKRLRLTEARRLMLDENKNVTEASLEVGYESVSQFIRDYRKMFGLPPKEDILNLRGQRKK